MPDISSYLEDAAHYPGGHAAGVVLPQSVAEVRDAVLRTGAVLAIGAQSSLTGGATPMGELIVATSRMTRVLERTAATITVEAGMTVAALQARLTEEGAWFPPAPTYTGACIGGIVATNAAGAATFKYGTTRRWVEGLHVVLADGDEVAVRRGEIRVTDGALSIAGRRMPIPRYTMPRVAKVSAGYFSDPAMDAVDLFVGSEGTLHAPDTPLVRLCRLLADFGLLEVTELALPWDTSRIRDLIGFREAVPAGVNYRVGRAQATIDPRIGKTAADMVVPFERFAEMNTIYREGFESRGLDYAIWGHISDGNVHPNVIPRSYDDVRKGREAILEFGREVARLGGCPLAEHGVGRNPVKQELLRQLYGEAGIQQMRMVKTILDPGWKLAPGVIFSPA